VERSEMLTTFNMGIGFCLIVDPRHSDDVMTRTNRHSPVVLGRVSPGAGVALR
jgi:phosphoribosylaminoimidazole (AIR) synthetase